MKKIELDDLVRDTKLDVPEVDWKSVDEKLFAQLEKEPLPLAKEDDDEPSRGAGGRVVWIGAAFTLAAAAAALVLIHPAHQNFVARGEVAVGPNASHARASLARGDRVDVVDEVAYFESPGKVRWAAPRGSVLRVEHADSPLVLSLEKGAAEAQVTPVASGEAFAIDVTASSGAVVRVAVHGTHLRVSREGDHVTVDLTEGVISVGAPPRRGSTIGTLVTAPAHVELDARDVQSIRVDHAQSAIRPAERVAPETQQTDVATASLAPPPDSHDSSQSAAPDLHTAPIAIHKHHNATSAVAVVEPEAAWLTTPEAMANALAACGRDALAPQTTFSTTLSLQVRDDGTIQSGRFAPPLLPEARDCAANVIYKRTKLAAGGAFSVPVRITAR